MVGAARSGRFAEYNMRCACIAQLVEQLTLNWGHTADSRTPADALAADFSQLIRAPDLPAVLHKSVAITCLSVW